MNGMSSKWVQKADGKGRGLSWDLGYIERKRYFPVTDTCIWVNEDDTHFMDEYPPGLKAPASTFSSIYYRVGFFIQTAFLLPYPEITFK